MFSGAASATKRKPVWNLVVGIEGWLCCCCSYYCCRYHRHCSFLPSFLPFTKSFRFLVRSISLLCLSVRPLSCSIDSLEPAAKARESPSDPVRAARIMCARNREKHRTHAAPARRRAQLKLNASKHTDQLAPAQKRLPAGIFVSLLVLSFLLLLLMVMFFTWLSLLTLSRPLGLIIGPPFWQVFKPTQESFLSLDSIVDGTQNFSTSVSWFIGQNWARSVNLSGRCSATLIVQRDKFVNWPRELIDYYLWAK